MARAAAPAGSSSRPRRGVAVDAARRSPRQERAQATVNAILAGAVRELVAVGFEGITTNGIATAAGVSIGSLYQYFANKDEIVMAPIDRQCQIMTDIINVGVRTYAAAPVGELVRGLVAAILEAHRSDAGFFSVLRSQIPRTHRFCRIDEVLDQIVGLLGFAFAGRQAELRVQDPQQAAYLVVHAVDGVLDSALRQGKFSADYDALVGEVGDLVLLYLQGPGASVTRG